jgi:hypothetical protein
MGSNAPNFSPSSPGAVVVGLEALLFGVWALLQAVKKLAKRLMLRVRARGDRIYLCMAVKSRMSQGCKAEKPGLGKF